MVLKQKSRGNRNGGLATRKTKRRPFKADAPFVTARALWLRYKLRVLLTSDRSAPWLP
jgi:hypothetical protein